MLQVLICHEKEIKGLLNSFFIPGLHNMRPTRAFSIAENVAKVLLRVMDNRTNSSLTVPSFWGTSCFHTTAMIRSCACLFFHSCKPPMTLQERCPTRMRPGIPSFQHLHLWSVKHCIQKVCICWQSSNPTCWLRWARQWKGCWAKTWQP